MVIVIWLSFVVFECFARWLWSNALLVILDSALLLEPVTSDAFDILVATFRSRNKASLILRKKRAVINLKWALSNIETQEM